MKAEILFYKTKQTEVNRPLLEKFLSQYAFSLERISGASSPEQLAKRLGEAVAQSHLVLISGGLELDGKENLKNVLSAALHLPLFNQHNGVPAQAVLSGAQALENQNGGVCGAALRRGTQILFLLPEDSQDLEAVLDSAGRYLQKHLGLTPKPEQTPEKGASLLKKDEPEDIRSFLEPSVPQAKRLGTRRRILIAVLSVLAVLIFLFLVYRIYFYK